MSDPGEKLSTNIYWQTPENVLELVRKLGPIELDPCSAVNNPTQARVHLTDGGLGANWFELSDAVDRDYGLVFVNPPYGLLIKQWAAKIIQEGEWCEIIALVPGRIDTRWYNSLNEFARARCEVRGRLKFKGANAGAKFPNVLFYWGYRPFLFAHIFSELGRCQVMR